MRLSKIKLAGFKSFVDPTNITFPSSLVGVVGPNGLSLDDRRPDWGMWLKAAGVRQQVDANRGQHFSHTALA
jgi:hypothetical protein